MKKFLAILLLLVSFVGLIACNEDDNDVDNPSGNTVKPTKIEINETATTVSFGTSVELKVTLTPSNATASLVQYRSSDNNIATVTKTGKVEFIAAGEVTITAYSGNVTDEIKFTVVQPEITSIEIDAVEKVFVGSSIDLDYTTVPEGLTAEIQWTVDDPTIAAIEVNEGKTSLKGLAIGNVTLTATLADKPAITATLQVAVTEVASSDVRDVKIDGATTLYLGYTTRLTATVLPLEANQAVTWETATPRIVAIDEDGYVDAISVGRGRIKATSVASEGNVSSAWFTITVEEEPSSVTKPDMGGYVIKIMQASSALNEIDPHLDGYGGSDRQAKIDAWDDVQDEYNCTISVVPYPDEAPWGPKRREYINNAAVGGNVEADLYTTPTSWLKEFVDSGAALDISEYYATYGKEQMDPSLKGAGTVAGGLYIASQGISKSTLYVDNGLFYNVEKLEGIGVEDPAEMFLDGRWTYTNFTNWVKEVQAQLPSGSYALGGHSLYFYLGMTAAAGVKIVDDVTKEINIYSAASERALTLLNELVVAGAMNPKADWAEGGGEENGFQNQTTMMTSGHLSFIHLANRWAEGMWAEGEKPNIGYVPYPYPDEMDMDDTRVVAGGVDSGLMYAANKTYPSGITAEYVYMAINDMFLNTIINQKTSPTYDAQAELRTLLTNKLSNEASVEAAMYYTAKRAFYDPVNSLYPSTADNILRSVTMEIVYDSADYKQAMASIESTLAAKVDEILS